MDGGGRHILCGFGGCARSRLRSARGFSLKWTNGGGVRWDFVSGRGELGYSFSCWKM